MNGSSSVAPSPFHESDEEVQDPQRHGDPDGQKSESAQDRRDNRSRWPGFLNDDSLGPHGGEASAASKKVRMSAKATRRYSSKGDPRSDFLVQ